MALRSADEYRRGLRDGRKVYLAGNQIPDVTEDPYIKVGVETAAFDFLMGHDPAFQEIAVAEDPETGEPISRYFDVPDDPGAVARRFELVLAACHYADGALPFVKDVGTDIINGLTAVARAAGNQTYAQRIADYRRHCARKDLSMAGAVTDVKGDRMKRPHQQEDPETRRRQVLQTAYPSRNQATCYRSSENRSAQRLLLCGGDLHRRT